MLTSKTKYKICITRINNLNNLTIETNLEMFGRDLVQSVPNKIVEFSEENRLSVVRFTDVDVIERY